MKQDFYVDLHCHPSVKPFGRAYPGNINNNDPLMEDSIWHNDPPTKKDKRLNKKFPKVTLFSQSDFTTLHQGNFKVVVVALSPIEKGFFTSHLGEGDRADKVYDFITMIGEKKIDFIQRNNNYFLELYAEYSFYKQLNDSMVKIYGEDLRYKLTSCYGDIANNLQIPGVISVVLSIEGGHAFNMDNSKPATVKILSNINLVKQWPQPPFFVTLSHHFYNELGGHAQSLPPGIVSRLVDQSHGIDTGITPLGEKVFKRLLSKANGRRIYIDIKHMSRQVRRDYYFLLATKYRKINIPIIVSHGALNGYPSVYDDECPNKGKHGPFWGKDINFYDDEIVKIAESNGIFGLQIDDRLITNKCEQRKIKFSCRNKKYKSMRRARLVWNHIKYIAELLDRNNLDAWGTTAIGTDFDGLGDPIDGYWTSAELPNLYMNLLEYARNYMQPGNNPLQVTENKSSAPDQIMQRIFSENAMEFLRRYY